LAVYSVRQAAYDEFEDDAEFNECGTAGRVQQRAAGDAS